ncbi:MAG TPA: S8 family serine peptidase [Longimicrobiaceae bacterium]|nr:S8 family serine peptidase [Longimicrobiaceae bacterium]
MKRLLTLAAGTLLLAACQDGPAGDALLHPETRLRSVAAGVEVDPALGSALLGAGEADPLEVIVTFDEALTTGDALAASIQQLGAGVIGFQHLPMVAALATPEQVSAISALAGVRGLWANTSERLLNRQVVGSVGADLAWEAGYTGRGVGIAILDTGIDAGHPDLAFGTKTVQNVKAVAHSKDLYTFPGRDSVTGLKTPKPAKKGYEVFVENVENTDTDNGHGTHVAGTAAGSGEASGGKYGGVAPGAHLIGVSAAVGGVLPTINLLAGFDYIIENRKKYNIQVVNNSWGSTGRFNPNSALTIATREVYEAGITVVFAGGNEGPGEDTMNPRSVAPWVISVAAGCKLAEDYGQPAGSAANPTNSRAHCEDGRDRLLADFSSRGIPGDAMYHPDILAPGVHTVSSRASTGLEITAFAAQHDARICSIEAAHVPYYTCIDGTSMASPAIAGVVALMEEASGGKLTPDQALAVLTRTARAMPGYGEWEVGAGYVDALAAVKAARSLR